MSKQNGPTYQYLFSCWSIYSQSLVLPCLPRLYIKLKGFFCGTARLDSSFNKKGPQSQIYDLVVLLLLKSITLAFRRPVLWRAIYCTSSCVLFCFTLATIVDQIQLSCSSFPFVFYSNLFVLSTYFITCSIYLASPSRVFILIFPFPTAFRSTSRSFLYVRHSIR